MSYTSDDVARLAALDVRANTFECPCCGASVGEACDFSIGWDGAGKPGYLRDGRKTSTCAARREEAFCARKGSVLS